MYLRIIPIRLAFPVNDEKRDTHSTNTNITKIHRKLFVGENNSDPINNTELFSEAFFPY
jgi:hypothetical protein